MSLSEAAGSPPPHPTMPTHVLIYPGLGTPGHPREELCQTALGSSPKETGNQEEGPGTSAGAQAHRPSCIQAKGMGVSTAFRGLFAVQCFPLSHLSNAEMCPWVVPKANRQWAGHSPKLDIAFALVVWGCSSYLRVDPVCRGKVKCLLTQTRRSTLHLCACLLEAPH